MNIPVTSALASLLALALALAAPAAHAAGGEDNCSGFIDTLPATIATQGVWCLSADLTINGTSIPAVTITTNNVTLDCNDFGLRNGGTSHAGVSTSGVLNVTVRRCRVQDFHDGIRILGGGGHLVEDNLLVQTRNKGIQVSGGGNLVRRNRVLDTGGPYSQPAAIEASADVIDNVVDGVWSSDANPMPMGINTQVAGAVVKGNIVRGVEGYIGLHMTYPGSVAIGNHVVAGSVPGSLGIGGNSYAFCARNTVLGYDQPIKCTHASDNLHD